LESPTSFARLQVNGNRSSPAEIIEIKEGASTRIAECNDDKAGIHLTKDLTYLQRGTEVLDYLLLTQQVWNIPALSPKMVGGFTTQNTDAEWSDARECYAAVLLWDYYKATGNAEYLERSVAAARSLLRLRRGRTGPTRAISTNPAR